MKLLILGGTGMLGHRLWSSLGKKHDVYATIRKESRSVLEKYNLPGIKLENAIHFDDLLNQTAMTKLLADLKPDCVINCIGIIKQIKESKNHITSIEINSLFPHLLASITENLGIRMIHFSTDCVFNGAKGNYTEKEVSNAEDLYGRSKFLGEVDYAANTLTIRTSIIGRELSPKGSLIDWFLSQKGPIKGFKKAIYSGFPTYTFAKILDQHIFPNPQLSGLYHIASDPINKYDLLGLVKKSYKKEIEILEDSQFVLDRSLLANRFNAATGFRPVPWEELVQDLTIDNEYYNNY